MEKKVITPAERTNLFNEWLLTQDMPEYKELIDRQRWWVNKVVEFDKMTADEYVVCAVDTGEE